ncbi:hypothetical protein HY484_03045 [Candidatus Woesearchaeota archaeon]|nr:hypothetical protein [Candidatus Woesearchaeota archaeon]
MKKSVLFALFLLIIAACQPTTQTKEQQLVSFRSGSEGLKISFMDNLPPPRLFDNEDFNAVVQIENRGAADVGSPGDKIYLSGFDPSIISGISTFGMQVPPLRGKDPVTQQGDVDTVFFKGRIALLKDRGITQLPVKVLATACYSYETIASPQVCIDPTPFSPSLKQKVCIAQNVGSGTQGAPVAVTIVEVLPSPGSTKFKIHVSNVGGGRVFRYGMSALTKCSPFTEGLSFNELDYVELQDIIVSDTSIKNSCRAVDQNHVPLRGGQGVFYCEFNRIRGTSAYLTPLIIKLRYGYETSLLKNMDIFSSS